MDSQNQQNPQTNQPLYQQTVIVVGKQKSVGVAFLLAFLFGPLGLLYASITGGVVMILVGIVIAIVTLGFGLIFIWIGSIIWAIIAANNANKKLSTGAGININANFGISSTQQQPISQPVNLTPQVQQLPSEKERTTDFGETASKSINTFSDWVDKNTKGLIITGGTILGFAILFMVVKFLLTINFSKNETTQEQVSQTLSSEPSSSQNDNSNIAQPTLIENQFIIDTYLGTIGNKDFKLFIEKVDGEYVEGYNVTGSNRRPVKGRIVNKSKSGDYTTVFKLI